MAQEIHGTEPTKAAETSLENGSSPESQKHKSSHGHKEADHAHRRVSKSHGTENGSEHSSYKNPKKASKVGSGSPSLERSYDSSTPGKARKKSTDRHEQTPDHASAVPKFGDWNETDPASGDRYTGIFDKVREEKKTAKKPPMITTDPEFFPDYGVQNPKDHGCSCFGWFRK